MQINSNANAAITATGLYCPIAVQLPQAPVAGDEGMVSGQCFRSLSWLFVLPSGVTATIQLQLEDAAGNFHAFTISPFPISAVGSSAPVISGTIILDYLGAQYNISALAGGNITYAHLIGRASQD